MIKPAAKNKLKILSAVLLAILASLIIRINLAIPVFLILLYAHIRSSKRRLDLSECNFLNLTLLFVINFTACYFILAHGLPLYYMPFSLIPIAAGALFNNLGIGLLLTFASAITIGSLSGNNLNLSILFIIAGMSSGIFVLNAHRRIEIIRAGFISGLIQAMALFFLENFKIAAAAQKYTALILNSTVSSMVVIGALPVFEYLFKTATNISLLELADFNHPLLQRLIMEAPGTYHHSLVVGNLSEAACRAVGANALLARIGAYYHDIGKIQKPEYFSENQAITLSKHDDLSPTISKMVIMNHVKEGIDLAKKYRLNARLIDFIAQHHGNSLVYYFYRRALEGLEEDEEIEEEGFRYPGPKPNRKETAIVLLADSSEAATRALKEPTAPRITEVVHKIINNKFIDGQLDACDLTLQELERIAEVFIHILSGIYHSRVNYPPQEEKDKAS